ncbi:hypothetical protein CEXT_282641 [Caerostris extrusa]|uniref:Uncharacterized protein n=1 Tax=Caerostris extrusa TaxID=172846 RepID=A0AAV4WE97_CAEEX|nr:hypothetical protein CEXT_282641 [Caerostris extrusa]
MEKLNQTTILMTIPFLGLSLSVTSNPLLLVDIRTTCARPGILQTIRTKGNINCPHQFRFESSFQKTRPVTDKVDLDPRFMEGFKL